MLERIDTLKELQEALEDIDGFLTRVLDAPEFESIAKKMAIALLRPKLQPHLDNHGIRWCDVLPALELVDSTRELKEALADVEAFMERLLNTVGEAAVKMAIARLRPKLQPVLSKYDLEWADLQPALELVNDVDELKNALDDVNAFIEKLSLTVGDAAIKVAIAKLHPKLRPFLAKHSLEWADVKPALELLDTKRLCSALEQPEAFFTELTSAAGPAVQKMMIAKLRPRIRPYLSKYNLEWDDVLPVLTQVDEIDELKQALKSPEDFLMRLMSKAGPLAKKVVLSKLVRKLQPFVQKHQLDAPTVLAALNSNELNLSFDELKMALTSRKALLALQEKLLETVWPAVKRIVIAKLMKKLQPHLAKRQFDAVAIKAALTSLPDTKEGMEELCKALTDKTALSSLQARLESVIDMHKGGETSCLRAQPLPHAAKKLQPPAVSTLGTSTASLGHLMATFRDGPIGLTVAQRADGAVVASQVEPDGQAERQGVVPGSIFLKLNGQHLEGLSKPEVLGLIKAATRPLNLLLGSEIYARMSDIAATAAAANNAETPPTLHTHTFAAAAEQHVDGATADAQVIAGNWLAAMENEIMVVAQPNAVSTRVQPNHYRHRTLHV